MWCWYFGSQTLLTFTPPFPLKDLRTKVSAGHAHDVEASSSRSLSPLKDLGTKVSAGHAHDVEASSSRSLSLH